jgi:hypothetical protein
MLLWAGHVACIKENISMHTEIYSKFQGNRPLGRLRHSWEDNIKMELKEIGCEDVDYIQVAQDMVQWQAFMST